MTERDVGNVGVCDKMGVGRFVEAACKKLSGILCYAGREENEDYSNQPACAGLLAMGQLIDLGTPCNIPSTIAQSQRQTQ